MKLALRRSRLLASSLALVAFLAAPARAGNVFVVDPASGQAISRIQRAIDVSSDGDVILVKSGVYTTIQVYDKSLWIVADTGADVQIQGAVRVRGLAATRDVVLQGLHVTGMFNGFEPQRHGIFVKNCAGSVRAFGCTFRGPSSAGTSGTCRSADGAHIEDSSDVVFVDCELSGPADDFRAGAGLAAIGSQVALYACDVHGGHGGSFALNDMACVAGYGEGGDGGDGVHASNGSFVFAAGTLFHGGDGGASAPPSIGCFKNGGGGDGVRLDGISALVTLDGFANGGPAGSCSGGEGTCAACSQTPGFVELVEAGSSSSAFGGRTRTLTVTPVAREGQVVTLTFTGRPGDEVELLQTDRTGFAWSPAAHGVALVQSHRPQIVLQAGTIPGGGVLTASFVVPELGPGVASSVQFLQASFRDASGATRLGDVAGLLLLDAYF